MSQPGWCCLGLAWEAPPAVCLMIIMNVSHILQVPTPVPATVNHIKYYIRIKLTIARYTTVLIITSTVIY